MSKAVLVVDMPNCCADCKFTDDDPSGLYCIPTEKYFDGEDSSEEIAEFCPLKSLPEKMQLCGTYPQPGPTPSYRVGWNACLDQIIETKKERA